jgi:uncharacterized protein (DUF3820 family)
MTPTTHILPFGKHKGRPLTEVPTSYLAWALREPSALPLRNSRSKFPRGGPIGPVRVWVLARTRPDHLTAGRRSSRLGC